MYAFVPDVSPLGSEDTRSTWLDGNVASLRQTWSASHLSALSLCTSCRYIVRLIHRPDSVRPIAGTTNRVSNLPSRHSRFQTVFVLGLVELLHGPSTEREHFRVPSAVAVIWAINCMLAMSIATSAMTSATVASFCSIEPMASTRRPRISCVAVKPRACKFHSKLPRSRKIVRSCCRA